MIKTIYFDVGHTLVNMYALNKRELFRYYYELCFAECKTELVYRDAAIASEIFYQRNCKYNFFNKEKFWIEYYCVGLQSMGIPIQESQSKAKQIYDCSIKIEQNLKLIEGVESLLKELKTKGYTLGIISNWGKKLISDLDKLNIREYFDIIVASESVGVKKPDLAVFSKALDGQTPNETLMVGDLYYIDILPALMSGMNAVLYDSLNCLKHEFQTERIRKLEEIYKFLR